MNGKVAVVTGAARGIGAACARALLAGGYRVAVCDIDAAAGEKFVRELGATGDARFYVLNVMDAGQVEAVMKQIVADFGSVDVLVNNAGITRDGLVMRMKAEQWQQVLDVNLNGTYYCAQAVVMPMIKQRQGRIINIASVVGQMGNAGQANYCASKAGVIGLTKSLARELASRGITVNAVAPGFIETDMTAKLGEKAREELLRNVPIPRLGQPEDVAQAVLFLAGEGASYITGHVLNVNGGMYM
ncbi:MAG: 3-oxoacyl-[acyl-carrier-protein] reductase [Acidobacteria bacterium]|nr:3-oxoacyl-[acyl-carrier-protein] reductase [Acidobacteriota bacterium]